MTCRNYDGEHDDHTHHRRYAQHDGYVDRNAWQSNFCF